MIWIFSIEVDLALDVHKVCALEDQHVTQSFNEVTVDGLHGVLVVEQDWLDDTQ